MDVKDIEEKYEALRFKKGKRKASSSSSKYRGVYRGKGVGSKLKPWQVQLSFDGKRIYFGSYATEEEAARAHDAVNKGARLGQELNFPEEWKNVEDIKEKYEALRYKKGKRTASSSFEDAGIIGDGDGAPSSSSEYSEGSYANAAVEGDANGLQPKEAPKRRKRIRTCKL